jgi:hypothetical protein
MPALRNIFDGPLDLFDKVFVAGAGRIVSETDLEHPETRSGSLGP